MVLPLHLFFTVIAMMPCLTMMSILRYIQHIFSSESQRFDWCATKDIARLIYCNGIKFDVIQRNSFCSSWYANASVADKYCTYKPAQYCRAVELTYHTS